MMRFRAPLAAACLILGAAIPADDVSLTYAPQVGSSRTTTFRTAQDLDGGELVVHMDGSRVPDEFLPELFLEITDRRVLSIVETFDASGDRAESRLDPR